MQNYLTPKPCISIQYTTVASVPSNDSWLVSVKCFQDSDAMFWKARLLQNLKHIIYMTDDVECLTVIDEHYKSLSLGAVKNLRIKVCLFVISGWQVWTRDIEIIAVNFWKLIV